jgi:hypothetical protein
VKENSTVLKQWLGNIVYLKLKHTFSEHERKQEEKSIIKHKMEFNSFFWNNNVKYDSEKRSFWRALE